MLTLRVFRGAATFVRMVIPWVLYSHGAFIPRLHTATVLSVGSHHTLWSKTRHPFDVPRGGVLTYWLFFFKVLNA